jgi:4-hydroxyphenylpyruvate dioxygenase
MAKCEFDQKAKTDFFEIVKLDHLEWYVGDALSATKTFKAGLGMQIIGESRKETGNHEYTSYVLQTHDVKFVVTAPYLGEFKFPNSKMPNPKFKVEDAVHFFKRHGNGARAIGVEVKDAAEAYKVTTSKGAKGVMEPVVLDASKEEGGGRVVIAEILIYNEEDPTDAQRKSDTVMRFIQYDNFNGPFLPGTTKST